MKTKVLHYLMEHYGVTENKAIDLVQKYGIVVMTAEKLKTQPSYPAEEIAQAEKLDHPFQCAACVAEELASDDGRL